MKMITAIIKPFKLDDVRDALAEAAGVRVHHSSIANLLSRLGFTYKIEEGQKTIQ